MSNVHSYEACIWASTWDCTVFYALYFSVKPLLAISLKLMLGEEFCHPVKKGIQMYLLYQLWSVVNKRPRLYDPLYCLIKYKCRQLGPGEAMARAAACLGFACILSYALVVVHEASVFPLSLLDHYDAPNGSSILWPLLVESALVFHKTLALTHLLSVGKPQQIPGAWNLYVFVVACSYAVSYALLPTGGPLDPVLALTSALLYSRKSDYAWVNGLALCTVDLAVGLISASIGTPKYQCQGTGFHVTELLVSPALKDSRQSDGLTADGLRRRRA